MCAEVPIGMQQGACCPRSLRGYGRRFLLAGVQYGGRLSVAIAASNVGLPLFFDCTSLVLGSRESSIWSGPRFV